MLVEAGDLVLLRSGVEHLELEAFLAQLLYSGSLLLIPFQAHPEGEHTVVVVELIDLRLLEFVVAYVLTPVGEYDPRGLIAGEVHQSNAGRGAIMVPSEVADEGN